MLKSILGSKVRMSQIFGAAGEVIPVSVISAGPCFVVQKKTQDTDGYNAIQLGYKQWREKNTSKPLIGHCKKAGLPALHFLHEVRVKDPSPYQLGQEIKLDVFAIGDYVDVTGVCKGHGFAGGMKRHGFAGGPKSHGQSDRQRSPGSVGGSTFPARVFKGLRMAGHMGNTQVTVHCLEVVSVDKENNLLLIKGAVPGNNKGILFINNTVKNVKPKQIVVKAPEPKKQQKPAKKAK
ncbi:MAG: 50S ribosomal protein L3 [Elusimicrobiota bacterium]